MKPFRERNQTMIGAVGIVVILVMMVAAFKADRLPIIGAGDIYHAFAPLSAERPKGQVSLRLRVQINRIVGVGVDIVRGLGEQRAKRAQRTSTIPLQHHPYVRPWTAGAARSADGVEDFLGS